MKELPLRPNVCMLLFNASKKLWLGQRHGEPEVWQFPQGGVDTDTSLEENVIRELHEELGAKKKLFLIEARLNATNEYNFSRVPDYAKDKWRGQSQTFWVVRYSGTDKDFDLSKFEPEFMDYVWCTPDEVRRKAEPKRVKGYEAALREFSELIKILK